MQALRQLYGSVEEGIVDALQRGSAADERLPRAPRRRFYTCALGPFGHWDCAEGGDGDDARLATQRVEMPRWLPRSTLGDGLALRAQLWLPRVRIVMSGNEQR